MNWRTSDMLDYYLLIGLIYAIIGFSLALLFYFVLRKPVFGRFVGALIIALTGSFFGGVLEYLFSDLIKTLSNFAGVVNIFPPIIVSLIFLTLFSNVSAGKRGDKNGDSEDI
jgi:hypothetical protein